MGIFDFRFPWRDEDGVGGGSKLISGGGVAPVSKKFFTAIRQKRTAKRLPIEPGAIESGAFRHFAVLGGV